MSDIFLSYAREDRQRVRPFVDALIQEGWSVFWDIDIPPGSLWRKYLLENLEATRCFVVVWSKDSIESDSVVEEADEAKRLKKIIMPILLDDLDGTEIPFGFRSIHAANLSGWDGSPTSPIFQDLARDIRKNLGPPDTGREAVPLPKKTFTNSLGMTFTLIPAGSFMMGGSKSPEEVAERYEGKIEFYRREHPHHQVTISQAFYLQTTPVTQGQWQKVMRGNPSRFNKCEEDCPVENISWHETQEFIKKLNDIEKTDLYRLPSEAEWEYACRAGSTESFCFGDNANELEEYAWYEKNSEGKTHPVGQLKPNSWGLHDMYGLVWEWCQDLYGSYSAEPLSDPPGPQSGAFRVMRGGSWYSIAGESRSASRFFFSPDTHFGNIGFRVAGTC
jgi:formylglycine-generating enzyme required for sulfatase activity